VEKLILNATMDGSKRQIYWFAVLDDESFNSSRESAVKQLQRQQLHQTDAEALGNDREVKAEQHKVQHLSWTVMPIEESPQNDGVTFISLNLDSKANPPSFSSGSGYLKTAKYPDELPGSNLDLEYKRLSPPLYLSAFLDGGISEQHLFRDLHSIRRGKNYASALPTILVFHMSQLGVEKPVCISFFCTNYIDADILTDIRSG